MKRWDQLILQTKFSYHPSDLRTFNEIFMKNLCYDNIKIQEKAGLYPLFRKYSYVKTTAGCQIAIILIATIYFHL